MHKNESDTLNGKEIKKKKNTIGLVEVPQLSSDSDETLENY